MGDFAADGTVVHTSGIGGLNAILKMYALGSQLGGTAGASGTSSGWLEQAGTSVITVNGSGDGNVVYPSSFPNGIQWFHVQSASPTQHVIAYADPSGTGPPTLAQFSFRAYGSPGGAVITSANVRVTWRALGH